VGGGGMGPSLPKTGDPGKKMIEFSV